MYYRSNSDLDHRLLSGSPLRRRQGAKKKVSRPARGKRVSLVYKSKDKWLQFHTGGFKEYLNKETYMLTKGQLCEFALKWAG